MNERIAELEDALRQRDRRIAELTADLDSEQSRVAEMRDYAADAHAMIEQWKEAFDMELDDKGNWCWAAWSRQHDALQAQYHELLRDWNRFVTRYNAVVVPKLRNFGRPLVASPHQQANVLKRRKVGQSLRAIAEETGLGVRTVRTIIDKADGVDRATLKRLAKIAPDKFAEAHERRRNRMRKALPMSIKEMRKRGEALLNVRARNR